MGACSSQKQIRDLCQEMKQKQSRLKQIKLEIQKLDELQEKYSEQGLERQAELTEKKKNNLIVEQKQILKFLSNLPQLREIIEQLNEPISSRKDFGNNSKNQNLSEEILELEPYFQTDEHKLREEQNNQNKDKQIQTVRTKLPSKLQYPDLDQIKFIQIKQI